MPERTADEIRLEIASERQRLAEDLDVLHEDVRSLKPALIAGAVGVVLLSQRKRLTSGVQFLWRLL